MKTIIRKLFMNYEKEEAWLNQMAAKGLAFENYTPTRYVFEDSQPGEYIYRIELLDKLPSRPESQKYLHFMEENGVEFIASYLRWVYFRKKAADGAFDIYSDIDSKLKHYRRVNQLWLTLGCVLLVLGLVYIVMGIIASLQNDFPMDSAVGLGVGVGLCVVSLVFFIMSHPFRKKIKKLKKDKIVTE